MAMNPTPCKHFSVTPSLKWKNKKTLNTKLKPIWGRHGLYMIGDSRSVPERSQRFGFRCAQCRRGAKGSGFAAEGIRQGSRARRHRRGGRSDWQNFKKKVYFSHWVRSGSSLRVNHIQSPWLVHQFFSVSYRPQRPHSSGAVWESTDWGGRPGLSVLTSLLVSVDVKNYWTVLWHWSQFVPNMSTDIWGH